MKPLVFLSHSCNGDPALLPADDPHRARLEWAQLVCSAVMGQLNDDFDVWLDRDRIEPGALWRLEIFTALHRCAAGVLLLDDDAFASPWVRQEAMILNFRRRLNPAFVLVPVLLDGGSSRRFDDREWSPLGLRDIQALKQSHEEVADEVACRLRNLVPCAEDAAMADWVATIGGHLRPLATTHPEKLSGACAILRITPDDWAADNASAIAPFAQALLSADQVTIGKVLRQDLRAAMADREARQELRRLLLPLWVDLAAAAGVAAALGGPADVRRALLNTDDEDVAREYVDRAVHCANDVLVVRHTAVYGEDGELEIFGELEQLVIAETPGRRKGRYTAAQFEKWLAEYGWRMVLLLGVRLSPDRTADLIGRLTARFPGLAVFVLTGPALPDRAVAVRLRAVLVEPPLDDQAEDRADSYRFDLDKFVEA